jgi:hypothetical protein
MLLAGKLGPFASLYKPDTNYVYKLHLAFFTVALTNLDDKDNAKKAYDQAATLDQ